MKPISILIIGICIALIAVLSSCEKLVVGERPTNTPLENFQYVWEKFDTHYGLFIAKDIDWNEVYLNLLPLAEEAQSKEELFDVLASMVHILNDKHVNIYSTDPILKDYNSGEDGHLPAQEDYLFEIVKYNYLTEYHQLSEDIGYGKLSSGLGYIHISSFKDELKSFKKNAEEAIDKLYNTNGIVVDIRDHTGGDDRVSKYMAGRFATQKNLFMTTKKRNGNNHDDFADQIEWFVEKEGNNQYTKPVVLITSSHTISAGETFTLAMKENTNVMQVGDTTAGAFSDQVFFEMPNGWFFTVSVGDYRASDNQSYEGIGIAPDTFIRNEKKDVLSGIDKTLEKAIDLLQ